MTAPNNIRLMVLNGQRIEPEPERLAGAAPVTYASIQKQVADLAVKIEKLGSTANLPPRKL